MSERSRTWANVHEPSRTSFMKDVMNAHDCTKKFIGTKTFNILDSR